MDKKIKKKDQPKITREIVAAAAVEIADNDGIDSLSMRKVAQLIGIEAMSLYHHVSNKADLVAAMIEHVAPEIEEPSQNVTWQDAMRKRAHVIKSVLEEHTWAAQLFLSRINDGPRMMKFANSTIGYFLEAGFTTAQTDYAWNIVDSYIYGFNVQRQNFPIEPSEYKKVASDYLPHISQQDLPHVYAMTESIINGSHDGIQDFDFGLNLILGSLEDFRAEENNKHRLKG